MVLKLYEEINQEHILSYLLHLFIWKPAYASWHTVEVSGMWNQFLPVIFGVFTQNRLLKKVLAGVISVS